MLAFNTGLSLTVMEEALCMVNKHNQHDLEVLIMNKYVTYMTKKMFWPAFPAHFHVASLEITTAQKFSLSFYSQTRGPAPLFPHWCA